MKLVKATTDERVAYAMSNRGDDLYGYLQDGDGVCFVIRLHEGSDNPRYEVLTDKGWAIENSRHTQLCWNLREVREICIERCEDVCDCYDTDCKVR